ncbi:2,5-diamino-6-(ribosylamino)-4(3H)-pyrimidinone 5'-phosphate reductase [Natronomonas pharaonis DSM 2160]|uniref:2,5-diamino-6-(ribosylamino)-4(3H)-pyrimidinone 5'-phosphate reductase n=1 Tax=Natronomonas pharaonis (strain ATCC 35678 / DSM 2160 / CIP 103997 / JCM 8858 / NBRC 14720 / NCIMB 2260 / Gabara) TaxID=348780 RepID=A0A1U7EWI8_NATPD|nr:2,5-diamino-6-(ribosylamino)-4(3H)-pyrimidinone 5'-phosphate reductase [Natronomonas pharaonis]CAI49427.1 2,5-diamino-6-(ribosylamino)-4(3H)-pyrimidinone 5'-phosphate reductase [Natronomonas pharaonis DSM 2160]
MDVTVNAAMSADGKLSSRRREQIAISGDADFERMYRLRAAVDAVLVGVGTVLADNPSLRSHDEAHRAEVYGPDADPPARVVADSACRTPPDADILAGEPDTYVLTSGAAPEDRRAALREAGAELIVTDGDRVSLSTAFAELAARGIDRLMVEGGGELIFSLFEAGLVDSLSVYIGDLVIGGRDAPTLADGEGFVADFPELELDEVERLDEGVVLYWEVV